MEDRGKGVWRGKRAFKSVSRIAYVSWGHSMRTEGTKYFFLSMVGMSVLSAFSHITCRGDTSLWMDDMGDNVRECGRDTSDEFALPLPCASLEREGNNDQSDWGSVVETGQPRPLTEGVFVLEFRAHDDLSRGGDKIRGCCG
jgi:hypothetical protein